MDYLVEHCSFVRQTIETCKATSGLFHGFPSSYCNLSCIWLYDYLLSKGYSNIEFRASGQFLPNFKVGSHIWLYWNGYSIDISCDQFNDSVNSFPKVYVSDSPDERYQSFDEAIEREVQVGLEYCNPIRAIMEHNLIKERDIIYDALGIKFSLL